MNTASTLSKKTWKQLDRQLRRNDLDRWLSSRYAAPADRQTLAALYLFNFELARIRIAVSEPGLGAIRFQWWREVLEEIADGKSRQHEVALALAEVVSKGRLALPALHSLINGHEAAFEAQDRSLEPEVRLAAIASQILAPMHGWGEAITELAPHYAALRRGEQLGYGPVVARAPKDIRPAIAHFRLRRVYAKTDKVGQIARRLSVMAAIFDGTV